MIWGQVEVEMDGINVSTMWTLSRPRLEVTCGPVIPDSMPRL